MPKINPEKPNIMIAISFQRIQFFFPNPWCQKVIISITGGKIRARAELLKAPTNEITADKLGIAAAKPTEILIKRRKIKLLYINNKHLREKYTNNSIQEREINKKDLKEINFCYVWI